MKDSIKRNATKTAREIYDKAEKVISSGEIEPEDERIVRLAKSRLGASIAKFSNGNPVTEESLKDLNETASHVKWILQLLGVVAVLIVLVFLI